MISENKIIFVGNSICPFELIVAVSISTIVSYALPTI